MQTENWKKVKGLLNEVLPLDTAQREKFFEKSKIGGEIRREVESLLLFEKESEDLMHLSAVEFLKDFIDSDDENSLLGQNIGVYKLSANSVTAEWARFISRNAPTGNLNSASRSNCSNAR